MTNTSVIAILWQVPHPASSHEDVCTHAFYVIKYIVNGISIL